MSDIAIFITSAILGLGIALLLMRAQRRWPAMFDLHDPSVRKRTAILSSSSILVFGFSLVLFIWLDGAPIEIVGFFSLLISFLALGMFASVYLDYVYAVGWGKLAKRLEQRMQEIKKRKGIG